MDDSKAFFCAKWVGCTTCYYPAQTERELKAVRQEIAAFPSVSILGCEHVVIVSQSNGISHTAGLQIVVASTAGCYLQKMLLRGQRFGLREEQRYYGIHAVNPSVYSSLNRKATWMFSIESTHTSPEKLYLNYTTKEVPFIRIIQNELLIGKRVALTLTHNEIYQ